MASSAILGVHDGHNAAAALLLDGTVVGAVQEERFTRIKNQGDVPHQSIATLIQSQSEPVRQVALDGLYMVYGGWTRESVMHGYQCAAGRLEEIKQSLKGTFVDSYYQRAKAERRRKALQRTDLREASLIPVEHHTAHAAAAYYGSGWMQGKVLVLTCDGSGDRLCATVSVGEHGKLARIAEVDENHSIGRLYASITFHLGMLPLEHEYKVMGLAPYVGRDKAVDEAKLFADLFEFDPQCPMTWRRRKGVPPIYAASEFLAQLIRHRRFDYVAAGVQHFTEEMLTQWVRNCVRETGIRRVACSGGVFMNVKANQAILSLPEVEELFIFPSCGDETNSIGAAYWVYTQECLARNEPLQIHPVPPLYTGPSFTNDDVETALRQPEFRQVKCAWKDDIERTTAEQLAQGSIVARAKGPMEFGARALGNRSILADPRSPDVIRTINEMIKGRDFWMPFAPSVLSERAHDYYVKPKPMEAPHMIITFESKPEARHHYPAAQHPYDFTTRPQEVSAKDNPDYYRLLKEYESLTGQGIILNTSFNLHGEPIVASPSDALAVFVRSGLQFLALGNAWITKKD
jgi:carbamoyltransferase